MNQPEQATFLAAIIDTLHAHKRLADRAIAQVSDEKMHMALAKEGNSIVIIMKHVAGNLLSRWTDFLTTDGEKPTRHRDTEFIDTFSNRAEVLAYWEQGWKRLLDTLGALSEDDLRKTVYIRGEPHSVPKAIARSLGHTCYHVGQIVELARYHAGDDWTTLTIPRGESEAFNQRHWRRGDRSQS